MITDELLTTTTSTQPMVRQEQLDKLVSAPATATSSEMESPQVAAVSAKR